MTDPPRLAHDGEVEALARLWEAGWKDAHEGLLPEALVRHRTPDSFRARMAAHLDDVRVIGPQGAPAGFAMVKDDELYQLYVAPGARGSGVAARLIADAEARIGAAGFERSWLACAIGNMRAARFYDKSGWSNVGMRPNPQRTPDGIVEFDVWRFEKPLRPRD